MIDNKERENFIEYLKIIIKQIKQIENLVNEFSDFARMPKPIFKRNDLVLILTENIKILSELDSNISIKFDQNRDPIFFNSDSEQISRVFFNLIKNSIESIQEKHEDNLNFKRKIDIEINDNNDYIEFIIIDNGKGFKNISTDIKNILNPYFTTKTKGTGLGLAIVNKIINDHNGEINFIPINNGAKVIIKFFKNEQ